MNSYNYKIFKKELTKYISKKKERQQFIKKYIVFREKIQKDKLKILCHLLEIDEDFVCTIIVSTINLLDEYILNICSEISNISEAKLKVITITCFWIAIKFHMDDYVLYAKELQNVTRIFWNSILVEEMTILKKINYNLYKLMQYT